MHIDIIEYLRCPADHAESALVASATRQEERRIITGVLGCPVCGAEYPIRGGIADFGSSTAAPASQQPSDEDAAVRLAAQLDLTEPGRIVLLFGAYAALAPALSVMYDALSLTIGAARLLEPHIAGHASVLRVQHRIPLAAASVHGVAIDAPHVAHVGLSHVELVLRANGRLVAPSDTSPSAGMSLIARDQREWVAARTRDGAVVVPLKRAPR